MIYQPVNAWPTTKAIDITRDNTFTVEMNTSGSVTAYQLTILDWDNNVLYEGEKVILDEPLYNGDFLYLNPVLKETLSNGNDYKWRLRLFQDDVSIVITTGYIVQASGTSITVTRNINIKEGMYLQVNKERKLIKKITTQETEMGTTQTLTLESAFSGDITGKIFDIVSNFIDTTPDFVLYARTTPSVKFTNYAQTIHERNFTFYGSYKQVEDVPMTYYQITLSLVENNVPRVIYDTGKVYRADIKLEYDGYLQGNTYQIELVVQNEAGVSTTTGVKSFNVQYDTVEFLTEPQLYLDCKKHAIKINWTTPISFDPTIYSVGQSYSGVLSNFTTTTIQIEPGLDIQTGAFVIFDSKYENQVSTYNNDTGLLSLRYALENTIKAGTPYVIINTAVNENNIELLRNEPYRLTNSANILENILTFSNQRTGYIGTTPENDNITFQFKLPDAFWDGALTHNMRLLPLMRMQTEDNNIRGFEVFVNLNKLVYIKPALDGNKPLTITIDKIVDDTTIKFDKPFDFATQKYLRFTGYDDIIEIVDFDDETHTATLFEKPAIDIYSGTTAQIYDTLSYDFYPLLAQFPLQEDGSWNAAYDYIWMDMENKWNDELFWYEGGGAKQRVANTWFKTRINGTEMEVKAGGV